MKLCYILGKEKNYDELKFSLRSAEKCIEFDGVCLVGERPDWVTNIEYVENHPEGCKASRIMQNLRLLCEISGDDFIFVNDDYFFLEPTKPGYCHKGDIKEAMEKVRTGDYYRHLLATYMALKSKGFDTLNFDVHYPIVYNRDKLIEVMDSYDWDIPDGYTMKSLYCNTLGISGEYKEDCKAYKNEDWERWTAGKSMFSTSDNNFDLNCKKFLLNLYPESSKFEK